MAIYTVLEHPAGDAEKVLLVKDGFVVGAFVFTVFWALWNRMWIVAAALFAFLVGLGFIGQMGVPSAVVGLLDLGFGLIFGFEARRLQVYSLEKAGYSTVGVVEASQLEAAEIAYFLARKGNATGIGMRKTSADDMLNLFGNV